LFRSCLKRQPRGVFTVSGDLSHYDDGRRDLRLSLEEHFLEQIEVFNGAIVDNRRVNRAMRWMCLSYQKENSISSIWIRRMCRALMIIAI
jgi:hypothetical protein